MRKSYGTRDRLSTRAARGQSPDGGSILKAGEEPGGRFPEDRMDDAGRDFGERDEHEPPPRETGVRDLEARRFHDPAAREENVDVEDPRPFRRAGEHGPRPPRSPG